MRFEAKDPPRVFWTGGAAPLEIADTGRVHLEPEEQVTFVTAEGREYDVAAKGWGFYATPSVNGRLAAQGFRTALVASTEGKVYVMLVDAACMDEFEQYLVLQGLAVVEWLDER